MAVYVRSKVYESLCGGSKEMTLSALALFALGAANAQTLGTFGSFSAATSVPTTTTTTINIPQGTRAVSLAYVVSYSFQSSASVDISATYRLTVAGPAIALSDEGGPPYSNWVFGQSPYYALNGLAGCSRMGATETVTQSGQVTCRKQVTQTVTVAASTTTGPIAWTVTALTATTPSELSSIGISGSVTAVAVPVRLTLTQTPGRFRPRDARDPAASCQSEPRDCYPKYTAKFTDPDIKGKIKFTLGLPTGVSSYRPGTSSNRGSDTGAFPDYIFEQSQNAQFAAPSPDGLVIETNAEVNSTEVTVTSRDFGGVAILRAEGTVSGNTMAAELVDGTGATTNPISCAGSGQFASLPLDKDCNDIADEWERQYPKPGTTAAPLCTNRDECRRADNERSPAVPNVPGSDAVGPKGDGYPAFDEYRGFHFLEAGALKWESTDPVKIKDVFYFTPEPGFQTAVAGLTGGVATQLAPWMKFRQLDNTLLQVGVDPAGNLIQTDFRVNHKSDAAATERGHAVIFQNKRNIRPPGRNGPTVYTILGTSQGFINNGTAILLDLQAINGSSVCNSSVALNLQSTLIHEVGHKFGRPHPRRANCCTQTAVANIGLLTVGQFDTRPAGQNQTDVWVRLEEAQACGTTKVVDSVVYRGEANPSKVDKKQAGTPPFFAVRMPNPGPTAPADTYVQEGRHAVMSWTRDERQAAATLQFDPDDLNLLNPNSIFRNLDNQQ